MREIVDAFLAELRARYAECSLIELALAARGDDHELVGAFQARRDGIIRRHVYRLAGAASENELAARSDLGQALDRFRTEIDRVTRLPRQRQ